MPQQNAAQSHSWVQVAQGDTSTQQTNETVGAPEKAENPVAENPAFYYSGVAVLVVVIILGFVTYCKSKGLRLRNPSRRQSMLEQGVASLVWFSRNAIGEGGERFAPLVGTIFTFILVSNLMGVLPLALRRTHGGNYISLTPAPTSNLSMTVAVALIVFFYVQFVGIKENGVWGYIKHFAGPVWYLSWLMFPLEIIGSLSRPVSLSIRLFGNIFGEETVTAVLIGLALSTLPIFLPIPYQFPMLCFGVFGSIVQAGVFTILACSYISLAIGEHDSHGNHHEEDVFGADVMAPAHH